MLQCFVLTVADIGVLVFWKLCGSFTPQSLEDVVQGFHHRTCLFSQNAWCVFGLSRALNTTRYLLKAAKAYRSSALSTWGSILQVVVKMMVLFWVP